MRSTGYWVWRAAIALVIVWLVAIGLLSAPSLISNDDTDEVSTERFKKALLELDLLKSQNAHIKNDLHDLTKQVRILSSSDYGDSNLNSKGSVQSEVVSQLQKKLENAQIMLQAKDTTFDHLGDRYDLVPSLQFETTRRQLYRDIQETEWHFKSQLASLKKQIKSPDLHSMRHQIDHILEGASDRLRVAKVDFASLSNMDGLDSWRQNEAVRLSKLIQQRLHVLQHPKDCAHAHKLVCNLNKGCGYGCQIHHIAYCLIVAYGSNRTLILKSKGWRYNKNGWEDVFLPLSTTCVDAGGSSHAHWPGSEATQVIDLPIIDTLSSRPPYLPLAIPQDISEQIMRLSGNPAAWWVGQILKYILRPQPKTKEMLNTFQANLGFKSPVVGIHVRRTDKVGTEAAFHSLGEYMSHVDEYYRVLMLSDPNVVRRVFVASDDPSVIDEAKRKYSNYTVYGDTNIAKTASVVTRYSDASLRGIIADIHFLSLTDYLVCTFSSQVCRIAYEIMQSYKPDAAFAFHSLDDVYYYGGQNAHYQKARFSHKPVRSEEMEMAVGDLVSIAGNHWDGYSKGTNRRTHQTALYPSYKMIDFVDVAKTNDKT